jgi:hypothetical protein
MHVYNRDLPTTSKFEDVCHFIRINQFFHVITSVYFAYLHIPQQSPFILSIEKKSHVYNTITLFYR